MIQANPHEKKNYCSSPLAHLRSLVEHGKHSEAQKLRRLLARSGYPLSILRTVNLKALQTRSQGQEWQYIEVPRQDCIAQPVGLISPTPLVSIIIVSYNSSRDLRSLLPALTAQSYTHWELILVDNGDDDAAHIVKSFVPPAKVARPGNVGFAQGNNVGLEHASGELLFLINPDTKLHEDALKSLVQALKIDSTAAVAVPKIYFYEPFAKLSIKFSHRAGYGLDIDHLRGQCEYKKLFVIEGLEKDGIVHSNDLGEIVLDFSLAKKTVNLALRFVPSLVDPELINPDALISSYVRISFVGSSSRPTFAEITVDKQEVIKIVTKEDHSSCRYLINNAGSGIHADGTPYDIGFGQEDHGQFDNRAYVEAFCGCAALLKRDLFIKRTLFASAFFAYYEDSELSHWIRQNDMRILYCPSSVVYHKHSESTQELSPLWSYLVNRSRSYYNHFISHNPSTLIHKDNIYSPADTIGLPSPLVERLATLDQASFGKRPAQLVEVTSTTIGIYNSYWNTMGGGEKHALDLAAVALTVPNVELYLISEEDFSIDLLSNYFKVSLAGAKKLVTGTVTSRLTARFDCFINATFMSNLVSLAKTSYFIVSFPHTSISESVLDAYEFIYNSDFTRHWCKEFWGNHLGHTVMPIIGFAPKNGAVSVIKDSEHDLSDSGAGSNSAFNAATTSKSKSLRLLSVGRFNLGGHCKQQHLIAAAFLSAVNRGLINQSWQLDLVGSCNLADEASIKHLALCKEMADRGNINIAVNASRDQLDARYLEASVYVHATGLGIDPNVNPEKCEHFGIAPYEALTFGCIPVVYSAGGPSDLVRGITPSFTFSTTEELLSVIVDACSLVESSSKQNLARVSQEIKHHASELLYEANRSAHRLFEHLK